MLKLAAVLDRRGKSTEVNKIAERLAQVRSCTNTTPQASDETMNQGALVATTTFEWIDMLTLVDPGRHVVKGTWRRYEGGGLASKTRPPDLFNGGATRIILPVALRGGYEVEASFVKSTRPGKVAIVLPVGREQVLLNLGARYGKGVFHGLGLVSGKGPDRNEAGTQQEPLEAGRQYNVHVRVSLDGHRARIVVTLDEKEIIDWEGLQLALHAHWHYSLPDPRCLGLVAFSPTTFQRVRIRTLDGHADAMPNMHVERLGFEASKTRK